MDNLVSCIPLDGKPVDLQPLFFRFTLDTTTALLFGESVYCLKAKDSSDEQAFAESFNVAQDYLVQRYRLLDLYYLIGGQKFKNACTSTHRFVDEIAARGLRTLEESDHEKPDRYLFLDIIAQNSPTKIALRDQLLNILLAGRDTTACLLSWTLYVTFIRCHNSRRLTGRYHR